MIVIMIIVFLAGILVMTAGGHMRRAREESTSGMVSRLQAYISEYARKKGELPPDGFERTVRTKDGTKIESSAALYWALTQPIVQVFDVAGVEKVVTYDPIAEFKESELREEEPGVWVIIDGFDEPFHYDNTIKKRNSPREDPLDPTRPEGHWEYSGYELWSLGLRAVVAEAGEPPEEDEDE